MGRYLGPKAKIARREGSNIFGLPKITRVLTKRNYPPGIHGITKGTGRRVRQTEYGTQLREKQRMKRTYGLMERQFKNYFVKAVQKKGDTSYNLLKGLELRLDNIVYRMGLAASRAQARQMVNHAHILVNHKKVTIPSYEVKTGDTIAVREKNKKSALYKDVQEGTRKSEMPPWLTLDAKKLSGKVVSIPSEKELEGTFDIKLIIEFYSR